MVNDEGLLGARLGFRTQVFSKPTKHVAEKPECQSTFPWHLPLPRKGLQEVNALAVCSLRPFCGPQEWLEADRGALEI